MVMFAIIATSLMISSIYFPTGYGFIPYIAVWAVYLIFHYKCKNTEPEISFKIQRMILIIAVAVSLCITFYPVFARQRINEYPGMILAMLSCTLILRWNYYEQD